MTAEIAIMNRNAVVLAADSATTVTSWKDGRQERRYFKGANKLFELSRSAPVGLMIYGSAAIQGVPWELAIKAFREHLGAEKHDLLSGYANHFLEFVQQQDKLFTDSQKQESLNSIIGAAAWRLQDKVLSALNVSGIDNAATLTAEQVGHAIESIEKEVDALELSNLLTEADIASAIANSSQTYNEITGAALPIFKQDKGRLVFVPKFVTTLIKLAIKQFCQFADTTGIVIAGYGKDDFYPALEVFECYGFLGNRLIYERQDSTSKAMDSNAPAVIQPFATTSMIDTFRFGVAPDAFGAVLSSTNIALVDFAKKVIDECGTQTPPTEERLQELVAEAVDGHTDKWFQETRNQHFTPLSKVIHSLPLPDMAGLAKSLIELESLKERFTKPSESVSGPIDVAVISKYDGFVWIERKHYFRPELNPRYIKRIE